MPFLHQLGDAMFLTFHSAIILFNLFGWLINPLRKANLVLLLLTGFSWFVLGIWHGFGYCPLTQWHWQLLEAGGEIDLPDSYVTYLISRITGADLNPRLVEGVTLVLFFGALAASIHVNLKDWRRKRTGPSPAT